MKSCGWLSLLLLAACGSSTNDAALLNIDGPLLEDHIQEQLSHNASHHKDGLPLLLLHGMAGFAPVGKFDYFYHVPKTARDAGYDVFVAHTDPFQATAYRAQQLSVQVDKVLRETGAERLNMVAHSQGGLDARYLISSLG